MGRLASFGASAGMFQAAALAAQRSAAARAKLVRMADCCLSGRGL
jgi:hypothetical protein